ncbi:hypothetical protein EYC84_007004 [Monilinia fructicola]|uniref:Uncharacterized protein n=1 Tax=Monilinia fructicola TaxID=38448 RepID=A0A5M9K575_MONFR|nr:hypothetical protein EYC84_007004 [Monilinia fructicola]
MIFISSLPLSTSTSLIIHLQLPLGFHPCTLTHIPIQNPPHRQPYKNRRMILQSVYKCNAQICLKTDQLFFSFF